MKNSIIPEGALLVSCQADAGSPFAAPHFIAAFAQAAVAGGAWGLRLEGAANIRTVRMEQSAPIIGLVKRQGEFGEVYITPTPDDVAAVAGAGADIIAFDATLRSRSASVAELVAAIHAAGKAALADIASAEEALRALEAGADWVSTTLSGYTAYSPGIPGPDLALVSELAALGVRPLAEGRIRSPSEARSALEQGAYAVVVGSAITRPEVVTRWFAEALRPAVPR